MTFLFLLYDSGHSCCLASLYLQVSSGKQLFHYIIFHSYSCGIFLNFISHLGTNILVIISFFLPLFNKYPGHFPFFLPHLGTINLVIITFFLPHLVLKILVIISFSLLSDICNIQERRTSDCSFWTRPQTLLADASSFFICCRFWCSRIMLSAVCKISVCHPHWTLFCFLVTGLEKLCNCVFNLRIVSSFQIQPAKIGHV